MAQIPGLEVNKSGNLSFRQSESKDDLNELHQFENGWGNFNQMIDKDIIRRGSRNSNSATLASELQITIHAINNLSSLSSVHGDGTQSLTNGDE